MGGLFIKQFGSMIITSSASTFTTPVFGFSDCQSIQIFCATSASGTFFNVQGSPFLSSKADPLAYQQQGGLVSSGFYSIQSAQTSSGTLLAILPGQTLVLPLGQGHGMHQLRLLGTGGETSGQICAWVTGQCVV